MNKYLVFRLEREIMNPEPGVLFDKFPCFELVKEFEIEFSDDWILEQQQKMEISRWSREYSKDHGVRTVVIKGDVFGD